MEFIWNNLIPMVRLFLLVEKLFYLEPSLWKIVIIELRMDTIDFDLKKMFELPRKQESP